MNSCWGEILSKGIGEAPGGSIKDRIALAIVEDAEARGMLRPGVGRTLKAARPDVRIVLADPVGSGLADWVETGIIGADGAYAVEGIGGSEAPVNLHRHVIDAAERVSDEESFAMVRRLVREEGMLVGGSSGTNVVAALRTALRASGPVVTVLTDGWDRYRSKPWMVGW